LGGALHRQRRLKRYMENDIIILLAGILFTAFGAFVLLNDKALHFMLRTFWKPSSVGTGKYQALWSLLIGAYLILLWLYKYY
jgi:hypothetical protein